jgi:nitroreductase
MSRAPGFIPLRFERLPPAVELERARDFYQNLNRRRTVREFSPEPVSREVIELAIRTAGTAPSGAHKQPWRFVLVSDPEVKRQIRLAAEKEERENYEWRMSEQWKRDLAPLGTDWHKEFLEVAPCLIVVFRIDYGLEPSGPQSVDDGTAAKRKHYYIMESVGIAVGMLLAALHYAGLATLTHTPSPMGFLRRILGRPPNETPYVLIPVGYPAEGAQVPDLRRKPLEEILIRVEPPR